MFKSKNFTAELAYQWSWYSYTNIGRQMQTDGVNLQT